MPDSPVLNLHESLRQAKERWAIFLGAGASYDYGIPTMAEIADILRRLVRDETPEHGVSQSTLELLRILCPDDGERDPNWNIEDLLTRLYQLLDAAKGGNPAFAPVMTAVGTDQITSELLGLAAEELIQFVAQMCDLASCENTNHGSGQVDYLADFFLAMASFGKPASKLIRVFTTNIDLCVEASLVRLAQRVRSQRRPDLVLVDGFESAILPTFNMGCYTRDPASFGDRCAVYYWKLHGSIDWTYSQPIACSGNSDGPGFSDRSIIVRRVDQALWGKLATSGAVSGEQADGSHRIVIFPTPAKYFHTYTFPYMDMFDSFRRTLEETELLICVGTSFPDQHIRSAIRSFAERDNALLFVVDPHTCADDLQSLFGSSRSVQPVVRLGFADFVREFTRLESVQDNAQTSEDKP